MAVKGKGKQVASDPPASSGAKRRNASADAGPSSSSAAVKRHRRTGVLQFVDDVAGVDDEYEELEEEPESDDDLDDGFFTEEKTENANIKRTERSHPLPFFGHVKEEELSGDELEEFVKDRYANRVRYAGYGGSTQEYDDEDTMDGALKEPIIWRVKCMVGRERQMAFCLMQKFVDLNKFGTKVPIISAFSLDHVRGFVFVEAEKACDVTEACKGFCNVYVSRITSVPAAEVPSLLSTRAKPLEVSPGTWVRMKSGNYKGDLAQVIGADDGRKRVLVKLIPRVDLRAISKKFGGAISLKEAAVPAPRLIGSQELEFFGPHIERKRDHQTGDVFEVLDGLMFKDGFLYKRVALSSLIYWGIQPTDIELLKFSSSPSIKSCADDMEWVSSIYGHKKRKVPSEQVMKASSSKGKCSKASDLKGSTSTENYDDDNADEFNLHDLVLFGRKDFGVVIAVEKDGFKILKGGLQGSAVTVRKQDIKKGCVDKMFTAVDHQKKIISINDTVKVLEGPAQGKQGVVKHLYMGILFMYNESETENSGFFCAHCGSCENIKKRREVASSEDNPIPMFSDSTFISSGQNEQMNTERPYRAAREQLFSVGEMLRIRKGPLKGYLCRVVRIFRNDVTVKLDSLLKSVTVQAEFLSVPTKRGDNSSGAPSAPFGSQDTPCFGSEAGKTSWDNGLSSLGSDSWQPFSSSLLPAQNGNADGEAEVDPWCKKTAASADANSDAWGNKSSAVDVWNNSTTQKESSSDSAWDKQAGGSGLDVGGSSWGGAAVSKESEKSDNWGEAWKVVDMATGADADPWGSKVKEVTMKEADSWEKASIPPEKKLKDDSLGWGQSKSNQDQEKGAVSKDADKRDSWDTAAVATCAGSSVSRRADDAWVKFDALPVAHDDAWGKSKDDNGDGAVGWNNLKASNSCGTGGWDTAVTDWSKSSAVGQGHKEAWGKDKDSAGKPDEINNGTGNWNKSGSSDQAGGSDWDKPKFSGSAGPTSWNKGEAVGEDNQNNAWGRPGGNFEGGRGSGRGRGRGWGRESGDLDGRNDEGGGKSSWGNETSGRPSWRSDTQLDNKSEDSGGYSGRGRGRAQYGGRGRGRDNGWRNGERGSSEFGSERSSGDTPSWGNSQPWSGSDNTKSCEQNQASTWNSSKDKKSSGGEEQQSDAWSSKLASTACAENNDNGWHTKAKESSCSAGAKWENAASGGADNNSDCWNTKERENPSSCKGKWDAASISSGAEEKADAWNTKGGNGNGGGWNNAGSSSGHQESSWGKPSSSSGDQDSAWSKPKYADDNTGCGRGGFGRGNRGRGRGRYGDSGSSWNGRGDGNDESGSERSEDYRNRRDFDGGTARGRGRFGRGDLNQGNNFGSEDGHGSSWGSGRGNRGRDGGYKNWNDNNEKRPFSEGRGGGWSQSSNWNGDKDQAFSKGKSSWGSDKNDSWGAAKSSAGDDQAGKKDGINTWSQSKPSFGDGSSILGQWGAPPADTGAGSWGKGNGDQAFSKGKSSWGSDENDSWGAPKPSGADDQTGKKDENNAWSKNKPPSSSGSSILGQWGAPPSDTGAGSWGKGNGDQAFSKGKSSWGSDKNDSWGAPKPSGADDQTGKKDENNAWSKNKPSSGSGSSILGQWGAPPGHTTTDIGGPVGEGGSWGKSNEGGWNSSKGTGGSEAGSKKEGSWEKAEGSGSQGGGGSSWDKAAGGGWNSNNGGDAGNSGW